MDFSRHKLQKYLQEDAVAERNSEMASQKSAQKSAERFDRRNSTKGIQMAKMTQKPSSLTRMEELRDGKGALKAFESKKSDWRQELQEKVVDGQEREQHPYVTVMPTGDENLIQAMKQTAQTAKKKKDAVVGEGYAPGDVDEKLGAVTSIPKDERDAAKARLLAKAKAKRDKMKKEEVESLEEAKKKKCKDGYEWDSDEEKCVKKKKSKSRTTIIFGRGYGGHHHHDNDENDNDDDGGGDSGDAGGGDAGGGGMGEMFDILGDMLLKEKLMGGDEFHARMKEKNKAPINPYPVPKGRGEVPKKPPVKQKDTRTPEERMSDATGPRPGSRYRGD